MTVEFDGNRYREASAHQKEWGAGILSELDLRGDEVVLDVGCGDGTITAQLADCVPCGRVVGIDQSVGMLEVAQSHARENLSFLLLDVTQALFESDFDLIFSNAALHWVKDHSVLLSTLHRALRKGGLLRANFGADGNCPTWFGVARQLMNSNQFRAAFANFEWPWYMPDLDSYRQLLEQSPFTKGEVWGEKTDRVFPDVDSMLRWIESPSVVPFKQHLDRHAGEQFHRRVAQHMIQRTKQDDGTCYEVFRRINVMATK